MQEPYWWYVLYVKANTEQKAVRNFQQAFELKKLPFELEAFCPESEQFYRSKKFRTLGKSYIKRPLFPGYVFIETNMPAKVFRSEFSEYIKNSEEIIRLLKYGDSDDIALRDEERQRFEFLLKGKRCLEHSTGFIVGDKITITGGTLAGHEGAIKKINRHNRTADIEIDMFNRKQTLKVALEIVSKTDGADIIGK